MKVTRHLLAIVAAILPCSIFGQEWTTSYGCLARTSYSAGESIAPPFAVAWEYTAARPLRGAPLLAMNRAYVTTEGLLVSSLDVTTGRTIWAFEGPRGADEIISFDAMEGKVRWRERVDGTMVHTPQIGHVMVYVGTSAGTLYAFNQSLGKLVWKVSLGAPLTLAAADASLVVVGSGTAVVGLKASDGSTVFRTDVGEAITFLPALDVEGPFCSVSKGVISLDRAGAVRWRAALPRPVSSPVAVTKAGVLIGSEDGSVRLLSRADGSVAWETLLAGIPCVVSGCGETVWVGTRQGTLVGLALSDGAKRWSAALGHGKVEGVALAAGPLLVTAGTWMGALLPAPSVPANPALRKDGSTAAVSWEASIHNGSPLSAYRIWRRRGATASLAGTVPAGVTTFMDRLLAGEAGYTVSAVAANSAESARSVEVTLVKGDTVLRNVAVAPVPFDPRKGRLSILVEAREAVQVSWEVVDAEGVPVMDARTTLLTAGVSTLAWDGLGRAGLPVERGVYRVKISSIAQAEGESLVRAFPVEWAAGAPASSPQAGPIPGSGSSAAAGAGEAPPDGGSQPGSGGHDNGVRDHGTGEGRDGAGQGKGQGQGTPGAGGN